MASKTSRKSRQAGSPPRREMRKERRATTPSEDDLERMVEDATENAYDESQQANGFLAKMEDELALPFATLAAGGEVVVERLEIADNHRILAVCRRGPDRQKLPLLDLPLPEPPPRGWEWIAAYRYWVR
ncbi:MAG TPA: hypothetical protein VFY29_09495 [Terriglobia bacterium]|nr:hypothetical protein [Terriglobia bacterium]